jgi:hypothetical protein
MVPAEAVRVVGLRAGLRATTSVDASFPLQAMLPIG